MRVYPTYRFFQGTTVDFNPKTIFSFFDTVVLWIRICIEFAGFEMLIWIQHRNTGPDPAIIIIICAEGLIHYGPGVYIYIGKFPSPLPPSKSDFSSSGPIGHIYPTYVSPIFYPLPVGTFLKYILPFFVFHIACLFFFSPFSIPISVFSKM
jgi:hypothetical protein